MPKTPSTGWNHQPFLWRAAKAGMFVVCRCTKCRRMRTYLAGDLLPVFGRAAVIGELWSRCPRCGSAEYWREEERYPNSGDVGHTVVRRPNGFRQIQLWRDEYYEPAIPEASPVAAPNQDPPAGPWRG